VVSTAGEQYPASLVVLAIGINSRSPMHAQFRYMPPKTEMMAQDEVYRPQTWISDEVNAYFKRPPGLNFGAIIPKGKYLNISLLGKGFSKNSVNEFISAQHLTEDLQYDPENTLCGCNPRIAVSAARQYYGDRWVAVGDSAVTRLYKDGIGSAYQTAKQAMTTAVEVGITHKDFKKHYAPTCRSIDIDNLYGTLLFRLWNIALKSPVTLKAWRGALSHEMTLPPTQRRHMHILWGMLTGDEPYRMLFYRGVNLTALWNLGYGLGLNWKGG
jgi:flavin-dependent dehydrogenase